MLTAPGADGQPRQLAADRAAGAGRRRHRAARRCRSSTRTGSTPASARCCSTARAVCSSPSSTPLGTAGLIALHRVTVVVGVPPMYLAWTPMPGARELLKSLRLAVCGAAALDPAEAAPVHRADRAHRPHRVRADRDRAGADLHRGQRRGQARLDRPAAARAWTALQAGERVRRRSAPRTSRSTATDGSRRDRGARARTCSSGYWPDGRGGPDADGWWPTGDVAYADARRRPVPGRPDRRADPGQRLQRVPGRGRAGARWRTRAWPRRPCSACRTR